MAWGYLRGGKTIPAEPSLSACPDFSSCSRPHCAELPTPHCLCTVLPEGKHLPFHFQRFTALRQDRGFNSAIFSHICHVASAHGSISHTPSLPVPTAKKSLATRFFCIPVSGWKGSRGRHRDRGIPAHGVGLAEELPGKRGAVRGEGVWGGWEGPPKKGLIEESLRFPAWPGSTGTHSSRHCATGARKAEQGTPLTLPGGLLPSPPSCPAVSLCCRWCCKLQPSPVCAFQRVVFKVEGVLAGS